MARSMPGEDPKREAKNASPVAGDSRETRVTNRGFPHHPPIWRDLIAPARIRKRTLFLLDEEGNHASSGMFMTV